MDVDKIFYKIIGENIFGQFHESSNRNLEFTVQEYIAYLKFWLDNKLKQIPPNAPHTRNFFIGPEKILFDIDVDSTWNVSQNKLNIQSRGAFSTIKANCCIYGGKWMYEVQLRNKGVMQIGWCSNKCEFSTDTGVGDTRYSYGFDGSKQQIWHVQTTKYGQAWQSGDIIGVCLDMDNEKIEYFRNGESMGIAFSAIEKGPNLVLYPAVSLAYNEGVSANFGGSPFRYPITSYQPLQVKPDNELARADILLQYLVNLAGIISRQKYRKEKYEKKYKESKVSKKAIHLLIAECLIERISPLLMNSYVIEDKFFPYVRNLCVLRSEADKDAVILPGSVESTLGTMLSLFWTLMEDHEVTLIFKLFLHMLLSMFRQTPRDLDYERQRKIIVILTCICNHPRTRKYFIEKEFFSKNCLPLFLYLRPPEYSIMVNLLPDEIVWAEGISGDKQLYLTSCIKLGSAVQILYNLQKNLIFTLLNNEDGTNMSPSSRKLFLTLLRKYVLDNSVEQRAFFLLPNNYNPPMDTPVAFSFFCILVDVVRTLFDKEQSESIIFVNPQHFFDGSFGYRNFDRVGGVLSHLHKVFRNEIEAQLGDETDVILNLETNERQDTNDVYSAMFLLSGNTSSPFPAVGRSTGLAVARQMEPLMPPITPGNVDKRNSLHDFLDLTIIYFFAVGHKHIMKIAAIRDEIANLTNNLRETINLEEQINRTEVCSNSSITLSQLQEKFEQRKDVFRKRAIELARKQAWYRSVALSDHRRALLIWLLDKVLITLKKASMLEQLFAFVPEIYLNVLPILLDAVLDFSIYEIDIQYDLSDAENIIMEAGEFLGKHSADPRVILASCKDSLLQSLGALTCHEVGIHALENASLSSQLSLIRALLRPYENRAWGQSNWLLLRFWLGDGFAFKESRPTCIWQGGNVPFSLGLYRSRAKNETHTGLLHYVAPACPSKHFQSLIAKFIIENEEVTTTFINSVLSQLNWAFSEFILLLQEIQNISNRQEAEAVFEPRQLKICAMCFELTVSLMRSLEMIMTIAPEITQDPSRHNSELILNRICQLVSQVLSRVTVPPGCFQHVIDMCLPDLSSVTHFAIISAALGIILALLKQDIHNDKPIKVSRVTRALLTDPSFQIANIEFALGIVKSTVVSKCDIPRGNFDPKTRAHIDPLTNNIRVPVPSTSKKIRADPPIIKFNLRDYPTHVDEEEIEHVQKLIKLLFVKQSLLSDIIIPSEDSLCPICCAKPVSVMFSPCSHQSCSNCILHHLMNNKLCFYCKALIRDVTSFDGTILYDNTNYLAFPEISE